jgi:hypothetical protein
MLEIIKLYTTEGLRNYKRILASFAFIEPYCLVDYIDIFSNGLENLICFSFISVNNSHIIMPGYLKPIVIDGEKTDYFDFITPYGYTGPFFSENTNEVDVDEFWKNVDNWYLNHNVITEFIRFNLFGNRLNYSGNSFVTMLNIKGKILDEEEQWKEFDYKVRKNVNKARRENLSSKVFYLDIPKDKVLEFYKIYIQTMKRTGANDSFLYPFAQFQRFLNDNKQYAAICTVYLENIVVSSELLLVSQVAIYSFLGGTNELYFDKRPNDFLKFEALNWARSIGKKFYVLGGGYGLEDGIFKYKKSFFPSDVVNYYTGRKLINSNIYNEIIDKANLFRSKNGLIKLDLEDTSFFPLYNKTS